MFIKCGECFINTDNITIVMEGRRIYYTGADDNCSTHNDEKEWAALRRFFERYSVDVMADPSPNDPVSL